MNSHNQDQAERDVSALLSVANKDAVPPDEAFLARLPEQTLQAFMTASAQPPMRSRRYRIMHSRTLKWFIPAAAAAAVPLAVGFWPGRAGHRPGNGIAWADVLQNISRARTMVCWYGEDSNRYRFRMLLKDPGLRRLDEYYPGSASMPVEERPPFRIEVSPVPGTDWKTVVWEPERKWAHRERFVGFPSHPPRFDEADVGAWWTNLRKIGSDQARKVGEDRLDGVQTLVFEAPLQSLAEGLAPSPGFEGTVRVWVSKEFVVPVQVELRYRFESGPNTGETFSEIQWDVPLADDLFQAPPFDESWEVEDSRTVCLDRDLWYGRLTLRIGPPEGLPVITEQNFVAVWVRELTSTHKPTALTVYPRLTDEGQRRLQDYTKAHIGQMLSISLNGRARVDTKILAPLPQVKLTDSALGRNVEEFERNCLGAPPATIPAFK